MTDPGRPLRRLWLLVAVLVPALVALLVPLPAVDLAYQVRAGSEILATGTVPTVDAWTFTVAGRPWADQQWLAQVLLALVHAAGGWELLAVLRSLLVAATSVLVLAAARARGADDRTAAVLALGAFALGAPALALRPQLLAVLLLAVLLLVAARLEQRPRALLLAPPVMAIWVNVHGSFVLGLLLVALVAADELLRGRAPRFPLAVLAASAAATLLTPLGPGAWAYAAGIALDPVIAARVTEWQRTSPATVPGALFWASALVGAAAVLRAGSAIRPPERLWLLATGIVGAWAVRGIAWWPLALASALAGVAGALRARSAAATTAAAPAAAGAAPRAPASGRLPGAVALLLVALVAGALPWWRAPHPETGRVGLLAYAPAGIGAALRELAVPGTRIVAPPAWASWFEWAVPETRWFVDARFELYSAEVWAAYDAIVAGGAAAASALDAWAVELLVVPAGGSASIPGWRVVYADGDGSVLGRAGFDVARATRGTRSIGRSWAL